MMDISFQHLYSLSSIHIPKTTEYLDCSYNYLTSILESQESLESIRILRCQNNILENIPFMPKIERIYCCDNHISQLPIYHTVIEIKCSNNYITEMPPLPPTLRVLECKYNRIRSLSNLPTGLKHLDCSCNQIETIDYFPKSLVNIICKSNKLAHIPYIHMKAEYLSIAHNPIKHLPNGMERVDYLDCRGCPFHIEKMPSISNIICDSEFTNNVRYNNPRITSLVVMVSSLIRLPLIPPSIITLRFHCIYDSVFSSVIYNVSDNIDEMVAKTNIHHKFIHMYYCIRFKRQFMYWLWHLVRRPKIEEECHPRVIERLVNTIGMEAFLEMSE